MNALRKEELGCDLADELGDTNDLDVLDLVRLYELDDIRDLALVGDYLASGRLGSGGH